MAESATLSITKQFSITVGDDEYKMDAGSTVTAIGNAVKRQVTVPTASEVELLKIGASVAAGTLTDAKFCIIYNVDDTNTCRVRVEDTSGHTADFKLESGQAFDLYNTKINVSETGAAFASYSDWDTISAQFDVADGELIIFAGESC